MNLKAMHNGMGFPVGAVIPPAAWKGDPARHLELGALQETAHPPTVCLDDVPRHDEAELDDDELRAENAKLKAMLGDLPAENIRLRAENKRLREANEAGSKQVADLVAERDLYREAAGLKAQDQKQRELDHPGKPGNPAK